ncbi:Flp pilus assembly protein CpaB [Pseudemcibacter aquimaris]|nr:Flp pilus assembly protein CpaB [Pseudemcibacter aquimaris]
MAALIARSLVTNPEAVQVVAEAPEPTYTEVLVANKVIRTGFFLKREDLEWQNWPMDNINPNYIQKTSDAVAEEQINDVLGSVVKLPIVAGEPVLNGQIVKPGDRGFMAAVLTPGNRAISININSKSGISGFIFPGDKVDVLLTHNVVFGAGDNEFSSEVTETVMKDIRVLAIDTFMNNETNTPTIGKIATFEVTPKQAEKVALMSRMGELSLSLRSLAVESEDDEGVARMMNNQARTITYINDVSTVAGGNTELGNQTNKVKKVRVLRAEQAQELSFTEARVNN